ncbi:hypothetical protein [Chromobacterium alticapitis]|uniref:Uncharacterized protein n=1 Tax=Chromobacterium alticapitis TaxID=2073169 RepID=A0A2S5DGS1_9NEIS|nr:hypothetical protein [Chromobacterium alticapitis]POZ62283.1 hypothetical protein C2I19_08940 [Chromobacterium alticapitis]
MRYLPPLLLLCLAQAALASPPPENSRVPPDEAFQACNGKKAGDAVNFTTPRGEKMSGKCKLLPARLAAVPDHPPPPPGSTPLPPPGQ